MPLQNINGDLQPVGEGVSQDPGTGEPTNPPAPPPSPTPTPTPTNPTTTTTTTPPTGNTGNTNTAPIPANPALLTSTGGLSGAFGLLLFPVLNTLNGNSYIQYLDYADFNTEDGVNYLYRVEEVKEGQVITVNRVRIRYRDFGYCSILVTVNGTDDNATVAVTLGTEEADGRIKTIYADLEVTTESPQLSIMKLPDAGPMLIIKATMMCSYQEGPNL